MFKAFEVFYGKERPSTILNSLKMVHAFNYNSPLDELQVTFANQTKSINEEHLTYGSTIPFHGLSTITLRNFFKSITCSSTSYTDTKSSFNWKTEQYLNNLCPDTSTDPVSNTRKINCKLVKIFPSGLSNSENLVLINSKHVMKTTGMNPRTTIDVSDPQNGPSLDALEVGYFARMSKFKTHEWQETIYKADLVKISSQAQYQMKNVDFKTMFTPLKGTSSCPTQKKNNGLILRRSAVLP